jgi:hypothetical protein
MKRDISKFISFAAAQSINAGLNDTGTHIGAIRAANNSHELSKGAVRFPSDSSKSL